MKLDGRQLAIVLMVLVALIQGACGIQVTATGGSNGESGSVAMSFDTLKSTTMSAQMAINGATVTPYAAIAGPITKFEQTHSVKDASGKSASVYVKVLNAPLGLTYTSKVLPKEGSVATQTQVSAEQWLTVPKADSIKCTAIASYGTTRSASVGLEEAKNALVAGDYVTLSGYYGKAVTTGTSVLASQTATSGAANSIKIYGTAKDSSGTSRVDTSIKGLSGGKATITGLSEVAATGTTTINQVSQKEHVHGTFTSTASYTPTIGTALYKTRTSDYGIEYDLNMKAAKGSLPTGILRYYVKPGGTASKIQGAVTAAQSKDTINVAAGRYVENVVIDKSLTINGAGRYSTIVDGNRAGSVFKIGSVNPNIDVTLSGLGITGGSAVYGGGVYNKGRTAIKNCLIYANYAFAGGAIGNLGTATVSGSTISGNTAEYYGGGIDNSGTAAKLTVSGSTISENSVKWSNGGGGGIHNQGTATISSSTISGNSAVDGGGIFNEGTAAKLTVSSSTISGNSAKYGGGGIFNWGTATVTSSTISGNNAEYYGGGIFNEGTAAMLTVSSSTISGNSAEFLGGGISNTGTAARLTVSGSTISGNSANYGGGIYNAGTAAKLTLSSSTISGNSAKYDGGGICNYYDGTAIIKDSRIFLNIADSDDVNGGKGGGIYKYSGNLIFQDLSGNIITDQNVINSIVFSNYLKTIGGTLSNIET